MHPLGSTDPSCFPLQTPWSLQAVKVVWDYRGAVPWGGRAGGIPASCWEMTPGGWNSVCSRYSQISLQNTVFGSWLSWQWMTAHPAALQLTLQYCGTLPQWDWPCSHLGATSKERLGTAGESTSPTCIAAVQRRIHLPGACLGALPGKPPAFLPPP